MLKEAETRRSIRKYSRTPIEEEKLFSLLESARLAPSGSNTQPWHFIVVKSEATRQRLAEAAWNQTWMTTAPVHIACVADIRVRINDESPKPRPRKKLEDILHDEFW